MGIVFDDVFLEPTRLTSHFLLADGSAMSRGGVSVPTLFNGVPLCWKVPTLFNGVPLCWKGSSMLNSLVLHSSVI